MNNNTILAFAKKSLPAVLTLAIAGIVVALPRSVAAQTTPSALNDPLSGDSRGDIFSNRGNNGQPSSMLDIIHRAIQGQGQSSEDFQSAQNENLDDAAVQFRKLQQQRLQNPTGTTSSTSTPAPATSTTP
jgi:hypothetical protein